MKKRLFSLLLCGAMLFSLCTPAAAADPPVSATEETGNFTVTGGELNTDYSYADNTLTIKSAADLIISGTTTTDKIVIEDGVAANVTLQNVSIDVSGTDNACAFEVAGSASCTLTLTGTNTLESGAGRAGLQVLAAASLTITEASSGSLNATGGKYAAGIGGVWRTAGGKITINGGTVTATGGYQAAGIGGGYGASGGTITINGGTVTATGGNRAAGIGGGWSGYFGTIVINNGVVTAIGGDGGSGGSGIGGTWTGPNDSITIHGGTVTATGSYGNAGINSPFYTGAGGSAFIIASSISDKDGKDNWSGIIFDGNNGQVYGNQTLSEDVEIPKNNTLTIPENIEMTIPEDVTLTNNGKIQIESGGTLNNNGTLTSNGTVTGDGKITGTKLSQSPPAEGEGYTIRYSTKTITVTTGYEVENLTTGENFTTGDTVEPGTLIKCRKAETNIFAASAPSEFTTPSLRPAPTVSIDYHWEKLYVDVAVNADIEYSRDGTAWRSFWYLDDLGWDGTTADAIYVRLSANERNYASAPTGLITIPARPAAPTGLVGVMPTAEGADDGKITGVTADMKYWSKNTLTTATCPDGEITGLAPGTYTVWVEYTDHSFASEGVEVVVPDYTETYTLTVNGGTGSGSYGLGDTVTIRATVPSGQRFTGWTVNEGGVTVPNTNPASFIMPAGDVTVTANFETISTPPQPATYRVTVQIDGNGTASASPTYATQGTKITLTATAEEGYHFKEWQVISGGVTINNNSFTMPGGNVTVKAVFEQDVPVHTHAWAADWSKNSTHHWHDCTAQDCDILDDSQKDGYAAHTPGEWIIDQEATSSAAGSRHKECIVCGYITETETIPQLPPEHTHSFGPEWKSDADSHWQECACGEKAGQAAHSFGPEWKSDADGHWQECLCGEKAGQAAHTPGEWIVDTQPTSSTQGQRHKECTVCGYITQTETIPATGGGSPGGGYTPPSTPAYPPTVERPSGGGGTPAVTPSNPKPGDTVTVIPKPDEGYEVDEITVTDKNGKPVEVTVKPDGTYAFKQPDGKVKIEVIYKPIQKPVQPVETPWNNPFTDVAEGDWYYEAVRFVQERGLMNGYSDGRFGPNEPLSRAQLAQILFNKEGRPAVNYLMQFDDVAGEAWYAEAVRWAASQGIVSGYGNGAFGPNDPITREQLAVMLWRYSGSPAATSKELHFSDESEISGFALEALRWAVENGILNGYGDGRLDPQGQATRAQTAQMLKNFIENQEENT